ncbi:MAG: DNA methyltransferase, partial [Bradyrhizobium sp.]
MVDPRHIGPSTPALFEYGTSFDELTHYLFRYPAKFHPPIVRALLDRLSEPGETVYDPFIGSGSLAIEAMATGRNALGTDIDPLAVAVARAKTRRYQIPSLRQHAAHLLERLERHERPEAEYEKRMFVDLSNANLDRQLHGLRAYVPDIPTIEHWFRRYVIVDLARIKREIAALDAPASQKALFEIVFASIIRNASNADPVPVSGLEVTSHMLRKDAEGRLVNPFRLFKRAIAKSLDAVERFTNATRPSNFALIRQCDATSANMHKRSAYQAAITSPPYHGAVDYYRRHKLEMYWLAQTKNEEERRALLDQYIGRLRVPRTNGFLDKPSVGPLSAFWEQRIRELKPSRASGFRHYQTTMRSVFCRLAEGLDEGRPLALVVGHSSWNGTEFPTADLFEEIAGRQFALRDVLNYP